MVLIIGIGTMEVNTVQQDITSWLSGDDVAYRRIFDYFYPKLFQTCYQSTKAREDSEEMVMNVFLNIWQRRGELLRVDDFEKYLFRSAKNQISDFHRKNILQTLDIETLAVEHLGSTDHPELNFKDLEQIYRQALDKLSTSKREIFLLSREQGLTQKQIAEKKNISTSTVNNQITAALKIIRDDLGEYSEVLPFILMVASSTVL
ncbi:sigma-70 family RNA polymerase sigma factor [Sphingobacterium sp. BIGb0165]|jgi:RNA polymerase sigma factor, sigma-70 family|uniref:sigma-70 family RNA polymerase sigma factor n=1 Tax=Sphingobacterium sp. BIGb0165 TaxID=2940615 RepID=UPI00216923B2|nr:sigma-70 family RNA polymerase sigma factor [Sphingobacterium sp. BIGb0165]MCS4226974.1 RNA polymerase sigma-70 factor (ECF subfamily) [Sphingobacterium sp. BIGb0165]